ncbi:MAG: T9SS type A sorting domain-containing protein, partial [Calditrichaeota bacterium]|nr:T9SS type A sorting domain-containing protein [Calditrichota bacterium]
FNGTFRNCYFRNCTDPHFTYYGRTVSFPANEWGYHTDAILFENCTFANIGYVYQQENGNYADNVYFNHCTFVNVLMFSLESGWWYKISVTNSLWLNAFMRGEEPVRYAAHGGPLGGTINIDSVASFGFAVPFAEQDRRVLFAHNSYYIEPWLVDWMANNPSAQERRREGGEDCIPRPLPMLNSQTLAFFASSEFPYMNAAKLYEAMDPGMILPPTDTTAIERFLEEKWWGCEDVSWAWRPDLSAKYTWPFQENLAYVNDTLLCAAMGGFPLGDLYRWFPHEHKRWKLQADTEWAQISYWLEKGTEPTGVFGLMNPPSRGVPSGFFLEQNYPNPSGARTTIRYRLPQACNVQLVLFDLLGREVATPLRASQSRGDHTVTLDCSGLPEGVYLYQLQTGGVWMTRKLLVLK